MIIKPFSLQTPDFPDRRTAEQRRSYDSIQEKRWRWRVEQNIQRRAAARRAAQEMTSEYLR
jgi:hypothetical protein